MSDWAPGDLAVCVTRDPFVCEHGCTHGGMATPALGVVKEVVAVRLEIMDWGRIAGQPCGCLDMVFADGSHGNVVRFRKIRPDKHEECEPEFVTLLKRSKVTA
jgi:hypothetical protein